MPPEEGQSNNFKVLYSFCHVNQFPHLADEYRIYRQDEDGPFVQVGTLPATEMSVNDEPVQITGVDVVPKCGITYNYKVTAFNIKGEIDCINPTFSGIDFICPTASPTPSVTVTPTVTTTPSISVTPTASTSITPTASITTTPTNTPTLTPTVSQVWEDLILSFESNFTLKEDDEDRGITLYRNDSSQNLNYYDGSFSFEYAVVGGSSTFDKDKDLLIPVTGKIAFDVDEDSIQIPFNPYHDNENEETEFFEVEITKVNGLPGDVRLTLPDPYRILLFDVEPTPTPTATVTTTATITPTVTVTSSITPSVTPTNTITPTSTASVTPSITVSATQSPTPTLTPSITLSPPPAPPEFDE